MGFRKIPEEIGKGESMQNRIIKYRGKQTDNGEWVYGIPIGTKIGNYIITEENPHVCNQYGYMEIDEFFPVDPETVGQYTGLKDKNGKEIYEGDIVKFYYDEFKGGSAIQIDDIYTEMMDRVIFEDGCFYFWCEDVGRGANAKRYNDICEIIGNIHEAVETKGNL